MFMWEEKGGGELWMRLWGTAAKTESQLKLGNNEQKVIRVQNKATVCLLAGRVVVSHWINLSLFYK